MKMNWQYINTIRYRHTMCLKKHANFGKL